MKIGRSLHLLVLAKAPVPGRVKTRLCPPCSPFQAAEVAAAALADTLDVVASCGADAKVVVLDGPRGPWLPPGIAVVPQRAGALDQRLAGAWLDGAGAGGGWGVQIGMDTPQVTAQDLDDLLAALVAGDAGRRAVLGPATDGGWWAIGLPGTDPSAVFLGIPTSTATTGRDQLARLQTLGLDVALAPPLRDVDTADDLRALAVAAPATRTGRAARRVLAAVPSPALAVGVGR